MILIWGIFPKFFTNGKMLIIRRHRRQHLYRYRYRHRSFSSSNIHCSSYAVNSISNKTNPKANKNQSQRIIIINLYSITLLWYLLSFSLFLSLLILLSFLCFTLSLRVNWFKLSLGSTLICHWIYFKNNWIFLLFSIFISIFNIYSKILDKK